jgi:hypothetical protein
MELMNAFFNWIMGRRMGQIEHFMRHPTEVQEKIFTDLIQKGKHTEWGRKHHFESIKTYQQYAATVPCSTYEEIFPYIERMMLGEKDILWPGTVDWFAKSSGTTNARSKFIPVTQDSLEDCHYKAGKDLISMYVSRYPETKLFLGKSIGIGGSYKRYEQNPDVFYGDVSAIIMKNLPIWAEYMRTPGLDVALMDNWEEKLDKMARITAKENVTNISGVPTWTVLLLEYILKLTGKSNILEVWPNLEVFSHGAVAFGPYREIFRKLIPDENMHYVELYNASEGFFGMQDTNEPDEMLLMLDYGVFYEFIPLGEKGERIIPLAEVKTGENYAMVISTNGGLWRYKIGDTVRFTNTSPYRIKISGRTKHFINAFGEELIIENAEYAIAEACSKTGALITNFTAAPVYFKEGHRGCHEWVIEFKKAPENLHTFIGLLDNNLRAINSDYDAKRQHDLALTLPLVHIAPHGTFYQWLKNKGKVGGQNKVPRLSNNREFIEDILASLKITY